MNIDRPFSTPIFYNQLENENLFDIQEEIVEEKSEVQTQFW